MSMRVSSFDGMDKDIEYSSASSYCSSSDAASTSSSPQHYLSSSTSNTVRNFCCLRKLHPVWLRVCLWIIWTISLLVGLALGVLPWFGIVMCPVGSSVGVSLTIYLFVCGVLHVIASISRMVDLCLTNKHCWRERPNCVRKHRITSNVILILIAMAFAIWLAFGCYWTYLVWLQREDEENGASYRESCADPYFYTTAGYTIAMLFILLLSLTLGTIYFIWIWYQMSRPKSKPFKATTETAL